MDRENYRDVMRMARSDEEKNKVKMILNFVHPGLHQPVPDPYWNDNGFEEVYQMLDRSCEKVVDHYA